MLPLVKPYLAPKEELLPAIENVLYSGYIAEGQSVYNFESSLQTFLAQKNLLCVNSGTAALHIALMLLNIGHGDEVISTAMTAEPTNITIALTGAKIVWADVNPNTGLLDAASVCSKITKKTKAIMLVHYAGMVCDMDQFQIISKEYNIPIIEDAAHALGSKYQGLPIGCSKYICYSFQAIKHMTTVDGGALGIQDDSECARARKLRWFGLDKMTPRLENDIVEAGYKYSMNNVTAAIGLIQLNRIYQILQAHISNGKYFDKQLAQVKDVQLIPYSPNTEPSYWLYTLKVKQRDHFIQMLEAAGVQASPLHHRNDTHSVFASSKCNLPGLDEFYDKLVHIPCGWWVTQEDRENIVTAIKAGW